MYLVHLAGKSALSTLQTLINATFLTVERIGVYFRVSVYLIFKVSRWAFIAGRLIEGGRVLEHLRFI